ncbi:peptidyl-prolyl cis-trans isomerase, FKBP-type [Gleimia coleocanis DSM 15436]|uniref:Peptidyl-prolyl cis-trans isomerase n=1 Tax=Gleimia coleocanis DSM 15436 TaxID=525245 RepID=C0W1V1_9ACTO|nr:FKBP-type peptidyl-prolyl cis-trans isomerase [Gleimia coleocanis]EEH63467.1 peptidyl-prolyl cis-trans isomerase, FKBP-type [Gleimia coleocanis DSM 15436]
MKKKIIATVAAALLAVTGLAACGEIKEEKPADAKETVKVDRDYKGELPAVEGEWGKTATIKKVDAQEPTTVVAKTLKKGDGPEVTPTDTVLAHYVGTLWDGTVFDSSFARGGEAGPTPISFSLQQVIPGWTYGLAGQHVGDRVQLVIPSEWGYGDQGQGDVIKPGSTLVFVVDIVAAYDPTNVSALTEAAATGETLPSGVTISGDLGAEPKIEVAADAKLPTDQTFTVLAKGTGKEITADEIVFYHVTIYDVEGKAIAQSSWKNGTAVGTRGPVGEVPGVTSQTVGSRVVVFNPANAETKTGAAVFVVDITGSMPSK